MRNLKNNPDLPGIILTFSFLAILTLWYLIVMLWHPTASIMIQHQPYRPILWFISLAALAIPFAFFLTGSTFRNADRNRRILLFGIAILTSTIVHRLRCFIDTQFVFFLTTVIYFILDRNRHYRRPMWEFWLLITYILWNLVTLAWTPDLHYGKKLAGNFLPLVAYPAMFLAFTLSSDERNSLLLLFWRIALMAVLLSFLSGIYEITLLGYPVSKLFHLSVGMVKETYFDANGVEMFSFNMLYGWSGMGHPSYNAIWAVAASVTGFFILKHRCIGWIEFLFGQITLILLQFTAQSRIGILMMFISFAAAYFYLLWPRRKAIYISLAAALALIITAFTIKPDLLGSFSHDDARGILWAAVWDFIGHKPLTGSGLGGTTYDYVHSVLGYYWPGLVEENVYAHNQFLGDWMQSGVVGFILSVAVAILAFVMAFRRRSFIAFTFSLAILFFMFIEMPLRFLQATTIISFILCLFLHPCIDDTTERN